ncbi:MAG: glycosyltransferase [bacterium]
MQKEITLIVPTLTNLAGLLYELKALSKFPMVIVDNAPSKAKLLACRKHSLCTYLPRTENQGFARAINLAFPHVKTDWICILNDDIEFLGEPPFSKLIAIAIKNDWDAVSPLLTKRSGELENLGYRVLPMGRTQAIFYHTSHLDGLTAACLVMKSSAFRSLGGFDGRFFAYLEDVDLFLRLNRAGYHFGVAPNIRVIHNHMTTSGGMNNFKAKMDFKNWFFVIGKNWSARDLFTHFPAIFVERLRNLSGLAKATWRVFGLRSLYLLPRDLFWILKEILTFPFKRTTAW